jgi:hypothetical protein
MKEFKRNYAAEAELSLLKFLGEAIDKMRALQSPAPAATVQEKAQDEGVPPKPETAGLGHLSRMVH